MWQVYVFSFLYLEQGYDVYNNLTLHLRKTEANRH